jgi:hypothetical protein
LALLGRLPSAHVDGDVMQASKKPAQVPSAHVDGDVMQASEKPAQKTCTKADLSVGSIL